MTDPRRSIPSLEKLLESPAAESLLAEYPRSRVVDALRSAVDEVRAAIATGSPAPAVDEAEPYVELAGQRLEVADRPSLRSVINATGVVLHTNLGRAPLADAARDAMAGVSRGYTNLEYDLDEGVRGSRYTHCVDLLRELAGAEDALVVNNTAAALVLILSALARDRGVLVSRGELVEIGGGFRIPDIMREGGVRLVEVGSTNRTRVEDYREAADGGVAMILKVHRSNFRMSGFTEEASLAELAELGRELDVPVVHDLGSGLLLDAQSLGLPAEPRPEESLSAGADLVAFSGDKLLGGPQAGCIVGSARRIGALRACPLCRAVRVDKTTLAALEATLRLYRDPERARTEIPAVRMLAADVEGLRDRAERVVLLLAETGVEAATVECRSVVGGGTYPGVELPSYGVRIAPKADSAEAVARTLRTGDPSIVVRVESEALFIDVRTLLPGEEEVLASRLVEVLAT
jgi:L-seryl-tRNA(Ser) seleniumtransferase